MIFVTVGSQKFQFNRLLQAIDKLVADGEIADKVFAQIGASDYIPQSYDYQAYLDREDFQKKIQRSDIVITHGGTGAIIGAVNAGKKVIAVPRLSKYGEHVDDHQLQLIEQFTKTGLISSCEDLDQLGMTINNVRMKTFNIYSSHTQKYIEAIDSYLRGLYL